MCASVLETEVECLNEEVVRLWLMLHRVVEVLNQHSTTPSSRECIPTTSSSSSGGHLHPTCHVDPHHCPCHRHGCSRHHHHPAAAASASSTAFASHDPDVFARPATTRKGAWDTRYRRQEKEPFSPSSSSYGRRKGERKKGWEGDPLVKAWQRKGGVCPVCGGDGVTRDSKAHPIRQRRCEAKETSSSPYVASGRPHRHRYHHRRHRYYFASPSSEETPSPKERSARRPRSRRERVEEEEKKEKKKREEEKPRGKRAALQEVEKEEEEEGDAFSRSSSASSTYSFSSPSSSFSSSTSSSSSHSRRDRPHRHRKVMSREKVLQEHPTNGTVAPLPSPHRRRQEQKLKHQPSMPMEGATTHQKEKKTENRLSSSGRASPRAAPHPEKKKEPAPSSSSNRTKVEPKEVDMTVHIPKRKTVASPLERLPSTTTSRMREGERIAREERHHEGKRKITTSPKRMVDRIEKEGEREREREMKKKEKEKEGEREMKRKKKEKEGEREKKEKEAPSSYPTQGSGQATTPQTISSVSSSAVHSSPPPPPLQKEIPTPKGSSWSAVLERATRESARRPLPRASSPLATVDAHAKAEDALPLAVSPSSSPPISSTVEPSLRSTGGPTLSGTTTTAEKEQQVMHHSTHSSSLSLPLSSPLARPTATPSPAVGQDDDDHPPRVSLPSVLQEKTSRATASISSWSTSVLSKMMPKNTRVDDADEEEEDEKKKKRIASPHEKMVERSNISSSVLSSDAHPRLLDTSSLSLPQTPLAKGVGMVEEEAKKKTSTTNGPIPGSFTDPLQRFSSLSFSSSSSSSIFSSLHTSHSPFPLSAFQDMPVKPPNTIVVPSSSSFSPPPPAGGSLGRMRPPLEDQTRSSGSATSDTYSNPSSEDEGGRESTFQPFPLASFSAPATTPPPLTAFPAPLSQPSPTSLSISARSVGSPILHTHHPRSRSPSSSRSSSSSSSSNNTSTSNSEAFLPFVSSLKPLLSSTGTARPLMRPTSSLLPCVGSNSESGGFPSGNAVLPPPPPPPPVVPLDRTTPPLSSSKGPFLSPPVLPQMSASRTPAQSSPRPNSSPRTSTSETSEGSSEESVGMSLSAEFEEAMGMKCIAPQEREASRLPPRGGEPKECVEQPASGDIPSPVGTTTSLSSLRPHTSERHENRPSPDTIPTTAMAVFPSSSHDSPRERRADELESALPQGSLFPCPAHPHASPVTSSSPTSGSDTECLSPISTSVIPKYAMASQSTDQAVSSFTSLSTSPSEESSLQSSPFGSHAVHTQETTRETPLRKNEGGGGGGVGGRYHDIDSSAPLLSTSDRQEGENSLPPTSTTEKKRRASSFSSRSLSTLPIPAIDPAVAHASTPAKGEEGYLPTGGGGSSGSTGKISFVEARDMYSAGLSTRVPSPVSSATRGISVLPPSPSSLDAKRVTETPTVTAGTAKPLFVIPPPTFYSTSSSVAPTSSKSSQSSASTASPSTATNPGEGSQSGLVKRFQPRAEHVRGSSRRPSHSSFKKEEEEDGFPPARAKASLVSSTGHFLTKDMLEGLNDSSSSSLEVSKDSAHLRKNFHSHGY